MTQHGRAASTIQTGVETVKKEPVVITQGRAPGVTSRTQNIDNPSRPITTGAPTGTGTSGTAGTSGTTGGGDTGTSGVSGGNDTTSNQTEAPAAHPKPSLDGLAIDDLAGLSDEKLEEKYKEMAEQGMDVDEIKNKVETAKTTKSNDKPSGNDGRDKAGQVKGLDEDPDWGKPLDDKFDIQQGDFIEFLMKDVVLASAAWVGNKATGITGYAIYRAGSSTYHWIGGGIKKGYSKYCENREKSREANEKNKEKINNENLYSGALKHDDKTNGFAKKVLDARKKLLNEALNSPEVKSAQALCTYVRSTIRGEMDIDNAVRGKDGKYTVTRKYKDDNGKEQSQNITVDEEVFKTLSSLHENVQKTIGDRGDSPEIRQAMDVQITTLFENRADMFLKEKIFAADYAASVLIERAARMTPEELAKIKPEQELQNLAKGEGKLAYYHHLYNIEHRKPEAFKDEGEKSALQVLSDAGHAALEESVKKLNNSQYQEAYMKQGLGKGEKKEPPHNAALERIFIDGKSEYAPEINEMTEPQREASLKHMQKDAIDGYNRLDQLNRQQQEIDGQISAISSDAQDAAQKKAQLEQKKKSQTTEYDKGTEKRDQARAAAFSQIRGNTK